MIGREDKNSNNLFYTCSLIDYIARKTKNERKDVVDKLGYEIINRVYNLADVYHSDNIDNVADELISEANVTAGDYDNVGNAHYAIPSHWDIGKVYKRLILGISNAEGIDVVDALFKAYHSFVSNLIDDYNSSFYYEIPENILQAYLTGKIIEG